MEKALRLTSTPTVRPAREADLSRLTDIYNHYVQTTPITFDLEPFSVKSRERWFRQFSTAGRHRLLVAEEVGEVVGFAGTAQFRTKRAYDTSVEMTVYCSPDATGRGVGSLLYQQLFEALYGEDIRLAVAGITLPNLESVALHTKFGFSLVGVMHSVGRKFDRYWDVAWYERDLSCDAIT